MGSEPQAKPSAEPAGYQYACAGGIVRPLPNFLLVLSLAPQPACSCSLRNLVRRLHHSPPPPPPQGETESKRDVSP